MTTPQELEHAHDHSRPDEIILNPEWFKHPTLIINRVIQPVGEQGTKNIRAVADLASMVCEEIADRFEHERCSVTYWHKESGTIDTPEKPMVVVNPIHLGPLPDRVKDALYDPNVDEMKANLREYLPELRDPLIQTIGSKQMKLEPTLHPNFVNLLMVDDSNGFIRALSSDRTVILSRFLMAKLGAFKTIIVPYRHEHGEYSYTDVILSTMEGGHPRLSTSAVAERLLVFGSAREVGGFSVDPDITIPQKYWRRSRVVSAIRQFGRFLGKKGLLSPPVVIAELVKDPHLAEKIIRLLDYTRQAEGALWAVDPAVETFSRETKSKYPPRSMPLVTVSGTAGVIKTNLTPSDIVPIIPRDDGTITGISIDGRPVRKPSVEAEEFTLPLLHLPKVSWNGRMVPAFRAGFHVHRWVEMPTTKAIRVITTDISAYPPVGCGVDLMHRMSEHFMEQAYALMVNGDDADVYIAAVPNHGTNAFIPWKSDRNAYQRVMRYIRKGELVFTPDIPQV